MSAKISFKVQDRSAIIKSLSGVYTGCVVVTTKGPETPTMNVSTDAYLRRYDIPDPKLGVSSYSALNYLSDGDKLWTVRAVSDNSKYAAALVRSKVLPVDLTDAYATFSEESLVVKPLENGLTKDELDSYVFPLYRTNKEYKKLSATIIGPDTSGAMTDTIWVDDSSELEVGEAISILAPSTHTISELNDPNTDTGENLPSYKIVENGVFERKLEKINVASLSINVPKGYKVVTESGAEIKGNPVVTKLANKSSSSTEVFVTNSDYITPDTKVKFISPDSSTQSDATNVVNKDLVKSDTKFIKIEQKIQWSFDGNSATDPEIYKVVQSEFEERDAFLVYSDSRGFDGNNVSIGITPSTNYEEAFNILVYYKGVLQETWEVTRDYFLDGFQRQMQIENKVNGSSIYIMIKSNPNCVDKDGHLCKPLYTDHSYWRQDPDDVFNATDSFLIENLLQGHKEVKMDKIAAGLSTGNRIRFLLDETGALSKEYKVASIDSGQKTFMLDRPLEEDLIPKKFTSNSVDYKTELFRFDNTLDKPALNIKKGIKYFYIKKLDKVLYNYTLNSHFKISGIQGTLLDPGVNLMRGGTLGSPVTVGDLIKAANKLCNKESTPVTLLMDGGYAHPAYANALVAIAEKQGLSHAYLSNSYEAEVKADPLKSTIDYRNSLNLNTRNASLFSGWIKHYDEYNKRYVWTSPESYAVVSQSYTTRTYSIFTPAAGWERGKVRGDDIRVKWEESERDILIEHQINPIRYKLGSGMVIWGNETLLTKPSPLQLRSVNMLIIAIKSGVEQMLENRIFNFNNKDEWIIAQGAIDAFIRDEIEANEGVYKYRVAIEDIVTPSDIDNRRMPVFIGIQPTMDIQEIPVVLGIFNSTVEVSV